MDNTTVSMRHTAESLSATSPSTSHLSISNVHCDAIFKGALSRRKAAEMVEKGGFITFYPIPNTRLPIPARVNLCVAQRIYSNEVTFMELAYNENGWFVIDAGSRPCPTFDTLRKLLDFYSTYSYLNINTTPTTESTSTRTVFD